MLIETGFGQMLWFIGGINLVMAIIAFLSPVYGVHKRIRKSKERELGQITDEILKQRGSFQNPGNSQRSGQLADLVANRGLIEAISEWPFTTSTYTRIVLYTFLPMLTWGIGVIAEEIIGRIFL